MSYKTLELNSEGGALRVTLNRPEVLNATSIELLRELREVMESAASDAGVRAVMLTGAGRGFCAGADLATTDVAGGIGKIVEETYNPVIRAMTGMPKPLVAAVNGVAAGAGMSLALACDMRLLSADTVFALGFTRIGLVMDASSSYFLPRLVGRGRSFELAYSGRRVKSEEAMQLGLGEMLLPSEGFVEQAWTFVKELAAGPTAAYSLVKKQLNASESNSLEAQLALEARLQQAASETEDMTEGIAAFREKRAPDFKGR